MAAKPIVAGTDGSEESLRAVDWAAREAALRGAPLRIAAAAAAPPRMRSRASAGEYERVTDVLLGERDQALAAAAERAAHHEDQRGDTEHAQPGALPSRSPPRRS